MLNNVLRARLVAVWFMAVTTVGAWCIVLGAPLTLFNAALLLTACIVPPLMMLLVWSRPMPAAIAVDALAGGLAMPPLHAQGPLANFRP